MPFGVLSERGVFAFFSTKYTHYCVCTILKMIVCIENEYIDVFTLANEYIDVFTLANMYVLRGNGVLIFPSFLNGAC